MKPTTEIDFSKLEKAKALYERVKELDAEIIQVEKLASLVVNKKHEVKFILKLTDLERVDPKEKVSFDEDGSLITGDHRSTLGIFGYITFGTPKPEDKKYDAELKQVIDDATTLRILLVILEEKKHVRELALKQLQKIGIKV